MSWAIGFLLGAINIFTEVNVNHYILYLILQLLTHQVNNDSIFLGFYQAPQ